MTMTPDEILELAKLMIRYAESVKEGKPIVVQCRYKDRKLRAGNDKWCSTYPPQWDNNREYREKPQLREFWINVYSTGCYFPYTTKAEAESRAQECTICPSIIHVKEVEDE